MDYHALENMTVIKLREEVKKIPDAKSSTGLKKDELIALLVDHLGIDVPEKKQAKKSGPGAPKTKEGLKQRITALRSERDTARTAGDTKKAGLLRRRIHILKRQLRIMVQADKRA